MKFPIIYEQNATDFFSLGMGVLTNAIRSEVTEERNGSFFFEGTFLTDDELFPLIKENRILRMDAGHTLKDQRFRIKRIVPTHDNTALVYAEHISYVTQELSLKPEVFIEDRDGSGALDIWKKAILDTNELRVSSDVRTTGKTSWHIKEVSNAREALGGVRGSILDVWGGEYRFDNYHISLLTKRGKTQATMLAYGRNIIDFEQERNIMDTFTSVYPYAIYTDENQKEHLVTVDKYIIDSEHASKFPNRKALPIDFSSEFDDKNKPDAKKLKSLAEKYIKNNEVGVPKTSIKLKFVDLSKTLEYKDIAPLEQLSLCDEVNVHYEKLGVDTSAKVIKTVWNVIDESYTEVLIGEKRVSLSESIISKDQEIKTQINDMEKDINYSLLAANGKNTVFYGLYGEDGKGEPTATMVGDMWYKPNGEDTEFYIWNGTIWEFIMTTGENKIIKNEIEKLEKEFAEEKERVDKSLEDAEKALDIAEKARKDAFDSKTLSEEVAKDLEGVSLSLAKVESVSEEARKEAFDSKEVAEQAQKDIEEAQGSITEVKESAEKALEEATNAKDGLITINGKVEKQGLTINKLDDELQVQSAKVDANSTSVASLKLESDRIATEVVKTNEKVDGIESGGINLLQDTKIFDNKDIWKNLNHWSDAGELDGFVIKMRKGQWSGIYQNYNLSEGDKVIFSAMVRTEEGGEVRSFSTFGTGDTDPNEISHGSFSEWTRVYHPAIVTKTGDVRFRVENSEPDGTIFVYGYLLEKGNIKADWKSAYEDNATQSEVVTLRTKIDQTAESVEIKADKSEVDILNKTVKENKAQIEVHNEQIQLKASQSEVDKINDTVKLHESEIKLNSEQINLQTSKIDNHSTEIANIKIESDKISTTVSKVETDLENLEAGGRNLYLGTLDFSSKDRWVNLNNWQKDGKYENFAVMKRKGAWTGLAQEVEVAVGEEYTLSAVIKKTLGSNIFFYANKGESVVSGHGSIVEVGEDWRRVSKSFKIEKPGVIRPRFENDTNNASTWICSIKLEKNKILTDWSPAPEDLATQVELSNVTQTVKGLQVTVQDKASQSEVTIMSDQLNSTIKRVDGAESQITQLADEISIKASKTEVDELGEVTQKQQSSIDLNAEQIKLQASKVDKHTTEIANIKIESGKVSTTVAKVETDLNELEKETQTEFSNITQTVKGIQSTVKDKANQSEVTIMSNQLNSTIKRVDGTESQITQLSNQIDLKVSKSVFDVVAKTVGTQQSQIKLLSDNINLKVSKNEVVASINVSPEYIRIDAKRIRLSGTSLIDDAVIKSAMIDTVTANKINTGTLNASNVNIINMNAYNITTGFLSSDRIEARSIRAYHLEAGTVTVGFNAYSTNIKLYGDRIEYRSGNTLTGRITSEGQEFWYGSRKIGHVGETYKAGDSNVRGIGNRLDYNGDFISWSYKKYASSTSFTSMLTLDPNGKFTGKSGVVIDQDLYINGDIGMRGGANHKLMFGSTRYNGYDYPSLTHSNGEVGIVFGSGELYLLAFNKITALSRLLK